MKQILIDDFRDMDVDKICRTYKSGISALSNEHWDVLFLDHDLGCENTGYDIICWIENNPEHRPDIVICISNNPVGRDRINCAIKAIYGLIFDSRHIYWLKKQMRIKKQMNKIDNKEKKMNNEFFYLTEENGRKKIINKKCKIVFMNEPITIPCGTTFKHKKMTFVKFSFKGKEFDLHCVETPEQIFEKIK